MKNLFLVICALTSLNANAKNTFKEAQDSIEKMNSMNAFMKMDKSTKDILRKSAKEMNGKSIMRRIDENIILADVNVEFATMNINFYVEKGGESTTNMIRKIIDDKHKLYCNQKNISIVNNGAIRKINFIHTKTGNRLATATITKKECQLYKINGSTINEQGVLQEWVNIKKG